MKTLTYSALIYTLALFFSSCSKNDEAIDQQQITALKEKITTLEEGRLTNLELVKKNEILSLEIKNLEDLATQATGDLKEKVRLEIANQKVDYLLNKQKLESYINEQDQELENLRYKLNAIESNE